MDNYVKEKKLNNNIIEKFMCIICFLSNISQMPFLLKNSVVKIIVMLGWVILLSFTLFFYGRKIDLKKSGFIWIVFLFDIFIIIAELLTNKKYIFSSFIYPVHLSLFILFTCYLAGQFLIENSLEKILKAFIYSSLIVAIYILIDTFIGTKWVDSMEYLYGSKNSIATIFVISILCTIFYLNRINKILKIIIIVFFTTLIIMLKSRTNIIILILISIYSIFFIIKSMKKKMLLLVIFLFVISIILINKSINTFIVDNILLNNRENFSLNDISSGRINHIYYFINNFSNNIFIGSGSVYLESFPLAILMSYGILGAIPIFFMAFFPLIIAFIHKKNKSFINLRTIIVLISLVLLINGIFEELSPFGPGVKCYLLWMITGIYLGLQINQKL